MSPTPPQRNVLGNLTAFLIASLVMGLLAAGLAVPAIGASGLVTNNTSDALNDLPSELEDTQMASNTKVLAADGSLIATFYDENRELVDIDDISPYMQNAIVAIEDERFYEHNGVDAEGLARAMVINVVNPGSQGASTLTQQLVKNTLKEQAYLSGDDEAYAEAQEKSNSRKLKEMRLAAALEKKKTKQEILEAYLNIAWFGGQVNGIEAAAKYYFGTTAKKLTLPQAAMLAGMIQSPTAYDISDSDKLETAQARRDTVLKKMYQQDMITLEQRDKALDAPLKPKITPTYQGCANAKASAAYFCDYVYNLIVKGSGFKALGKTQEERALAIKRGGYTIKTTLDMKLLKAAWKSVKEAVPPNDASRVAVASVTVEPGTGKVLSMTQNKFYSVEKGAKNTTVNYSTDYQYGGSAGFQTGSTFKPVVLATWLKAGKTLNSTIDGSSGTLLNSDFKRCGSYLTSSAPWSFSNAADGSEQGTMSVWDATANSVNGAYIRMEAQLDLCDVADTAEALGMHLASKSTDVCDTSKKTTKIPNCIPSLVLGVVNQSPLTMANAYATFASGGKYCNPIVVTSIKDSDGKSVKIPKKKCKQTIDSDVAAATTLGLSRALKDGTAASTGELSSGQDASGKTGTTNDSMDTWFVGYTPQLSTSVWVGPESVDGAARQAMTDRTIAGVYRTAVFGGTIAAPTWKKIMEAALAGQAVESFPDADSSLVGVEATPEADETESDDQSQDDGDDSTATPTTTDDTTGNDSGDTDSGDTDTGNTDTGSTDTGSADTGDTGDTGSTDTGAGNSADDDTDTGAR